MLSVNRIASRIAATYSGREFNIRAIAGGDINTAFHLSTGGQSFFLKLNHAEAFPGMMSAEAAGLNLLRAISPLCVPDIAACGELEGWQYLMLEWLEPASPKVGDWAALGRGLAAMHRVVQPAFGLASGNWIGSLPQPNGFADSWATFYAERRIGPLAARLREEAALPARFTRAAEAFCTLLPELFPQEPAALLHGDLWSGNILFTKKGPALIDPAVYAGHREMDIGMTKLFGGFEPAFYEAYHDTYPLHPGWRERLPYAQLYPLLVHALLFGGGYVQRCADILYEFG